MRKRTGLRNRYRSGRGSYSRNRKTLAADRYGTWDKGARKSGAETIGGHPVDWRPA
jgi:hypothetical protein